jgi:uncharacterized membrane protein
VYVIQYCIGSKCGSVLNVSGLFFLPIQLSLTDSQLLKVLTAMDYPLLKLVTCYLLLKLERWTVRRSR